jgi:hypothetical protein
MIDALKICRTAKLNHTADNRDSTAGVKSSLVDPDMRLES